MRCRRSVRPLRCACSHGAGLLRPRRAARERHQRDVPRALDRFSQPALVPRTNSGHAPRQNLPAFLHELRQNVRALVVDEVHLLDAELTNLLLAEVLPLAAPRPPGPASWTSRTCARSSAFTPRAAVTSVSPGAAFAPSPATATARCLSLLLFLCHTCLPFPLCPGSAGDQFLFLKNSSSRDANSARRSRLFRSL
jgi:hypothetical protein